MLSWHGEQEQTEGTTKPATGLRQSLARQSEELKKNLRKPIASTRVAVRQELILQFPHFKGFLTEYSSNLSMTGMFVRSESPEPPGTLVDFEFLLYDGLSLIHGRAEVIWTRWKDEEPERPAGMGLRFIRLDAASRRMIRWIVERHIFEQGALVELKELLWTSKQGPNGHDVDLHQLYPYAGSATARPKPARSRYLVAAAAIFLALLTGGPLQQSSGSMIGSMVPQENSPGPDLAPSLAVEVPAAAVAEVEDPMPVVESRMPSEEGLYETVAAWARASSGQRMADYLALYAPWDPSSKVAKPRNVKLETSFETESLSAERARVTFVQRFHADGQDDTVRTTLDMARENGRWRILEEVTERRRTPARLNGP